MKHYTIHSNAFLPEFKIWCTRSANEGNEDYDYDDSNIYLICIVREIDLVEDLCCFMLNGFYLHLMGWILSLPIPKCLLESLQRVL